jgi:hypothetical protein
MRHLHTSEQAEEELIRKLAHDRPHRWIGIANNTDDPRQNNSSDPKLLLYAALTKQFTNTEATPPKQFPRLISFFGNTGKGKSTIIQNLVHTIAYSKAEGFDTPVVGASTKSISGGIHVYTDPETFHEERPIVYVGKLGYVFLLGRY